MSLLYMDLDPIDAIIQKLNDEFWKLAATKEEQHHQNALALLDDLASRHIYFQQFRLDMNCRLTHAKLFNSCYEMTFFNRKSQRTFTCQIVQNTKRHLKRAKTMQISGIGHSVIRGLVTTGQWFSASTTVYPRGSPQGRRHSYFVDC